MFRFSWFRRLLSLVLAVLVLTASVGLTVQRHTCRLSGHSQVALSVSGPRALRGCDEDEQLAPAPLLQPDRCCDFSSHLHKLTTPAHKLAAKVLVPAPPLLVLWLPAPTWAPVAQAHIHPLPGWFAADSSPPPLGGRALLAWACTLVV